MRSLWAINLRVSMLIFNLLIVLLQYLTMTLFQAYCEEDEASIININECLSYYTALSTL